MNPINPYRSFSTGSSHVPKDSKEDPLRGVGEGSKFTRRGAVRKKGVRGASGYLESRVGKAGDKKAQAAAAKMSGFGKAIKETGEKAAAAVRGAVGGVKEKIIKTAKDLKGKFQEKVDGKKEKSAPEQMKALAKEAKEKVEKLVSRGKRGSTGESSEGPAFKIPRPEINLEGASTFSPDLGAIVGRKPVKIPRAKVPTGKGGSKVGKLAAGLKRSSRSGGIRRKGPKFSPDLTKVNPEKFIFPRAKVDGDGTTKTEAPRKSERLEGKKNKGILKQPGKPKTGDKGVRWADQENKPLE